MKIPKVTGIILPVTLLITAVSCGGGESDATLQFEQVSREDITVTVSGNGNIKAYREVNLSFKSGGRVAEVFVKEGDPVNQGDQLARLDTSDIEVAVGQAALSLNQAKVSLSQAKLAEETAAYNLNKTTESKDSLDLALFKAQIDVDTAAYNLETAQETYKWPAIRDTQSDVDDAMALVQYAVDGLQDASTEADITTWQNFLIRAQAQLDAAEEKLDAQFAGYDKKEVAIKKQQLQAAEMTAAQAEKDLEDLNEDIALNEAQLESARESTRQTELAVTLAEQSLALAQKQLTEATLTAPYPGTVASVGAKAEEIVSSATTIIHLVDASTMELVVELDEIDVPGVEPGQEVIIDADALPDTKFKGTIAYVYPVPKEESGIVLYDVKIHLEAPDASGLKVGMSTTADIITQKKENVLLIPSRAVYENEAGQTMVKVQVEGQIQEKPVTTGIDDGIQTEVLSGLSEGETIVIATRTTPEQGVSFF
ncbi:efflux RND transporter periplasmic adaptor subunit [Chloroflexota bacterium]